MSFVRGARYDRPAAVVKRVVEPAEMGEIGGVGGALIVELDDVVHVAANRVAFASGEPAPAVAI